MNNQFYIYLEYKHTVHLYFAAIDADEEEQEPLEDCDILRARPGSCR